MAKKHGKPSRKSRSDKFNHKGKKRHFDGGGDIDAGTLPDVSSPGSAMPVNPPSFGAAFRAAREAGLPAFTYNGKKYTTQLANNPSPSPNNPSPSPASDPAPKKPLIPMDAAGQRLDDIKYGADQGPGYSGSTEASDRVSGVAKTLGKVAPLALLGIPGIGEALFGAAEGGGAIGPAGMAALKSLQMAARGRKGAEALKAVRAAEAARKGAAAGEWNSTYGLGLKKGGSAKTVRMAKGGSVRGGGCETKGTGKGKIR
jgi:hypothetical protein